MPRTAHRSRRTARPRVGRVAVAKRGHRRRDALAAEPAGGVVRTHAIRAAGRASRRYIAQAGAGTVRDREPRGPNAPVESLEVEVLRWRITVKRDPAIAGGRRPA